jgi:1-acyl-sn-glycerol-3-phosphate acyltransferase
MMTFLRSFCLSGLFYGGTVLLALILLPALVLPGGAARACGRLWGFYTAHAARLCGLGWQLDGDRQADRQVIYAVKHQSAWETMVLYWLLDAPVIVLKKELMAIPVLGWFFGRAGMIAVDRRAGMAALKKMRQDAISATSKGRSVLIYPQGTRLAPGQTAPYQVGVFALQEATGLPVVPVALNSGWFWPKRGLAKRGGLITVQFLPEIAAGLARKPFMHQLEQAIETAQLALDKQALDKQALDK